MEQLDAVQAEDLGLRIFEPEFEQLAAAAAERGRLSFQDHLCLVSSEPSSSGLRYRAVMVPNLPAQPRTSIPGGRARPDVETRVDRARFGPSPDSP